MATPPMSEIIAATERSSKEMHLIDGGHRPVGVHAIEQKFDAASDVLRQPDVSVPLAVESK